MRMNEMFDNGYGVSVIEDGYGYESGLLELAVLHQTPTNDKSHLCYRTPITSDVIGWLDEDEVEAIIERIKALPRLDRCAHTMTRAEES